MTFDRVIQDSDDDEEPLGELSPEQTNRVPVTDNEQQHDAKSPEPQEASHDAHMGVNFDAFLQSPNAPQTMLSASQQRREDRWIPEQGTGPGRTPSMDDNIPGFQTGNMMAEIGFAQQRLFDDEQQAQYAHQPSMFAEQEPESAQIQDSNFEPAAPQRMVEAHDISTEPVQNPAPLDVPRLEIQQTESSDWSQSLSYNIFDSSSHHPSNQLSRADFLSDTGLTTRTEPLQNAELARWKTSMMQAGTSSPHDTEPFSSLISPKVYRAKSDNVASHHVQPSSASVDELALPVATEMPKVEKRGRKKKPFVPVEDDDDELALPQSRQPQPSKPEKRKPGRPPKNAKVTTDDEVIPGPVDIPEPATISPTENQEVGFDVPEIQHQDEFQNEAPPQAMVDEPAKENHIESVTLPAPEHNEREASNPAKEPKKKELKRGKTISVTQTKTHHPDVEDDVIWIDERPAPAPKEDKTTSQPDKTNDNTTSVKAPAPKKRGRKRKKTSEQLAEETAPEPDSTHNETGISVVLKNKDTPRTQTPEITNPVMEGDQQDQPLFDGPEDLQQPVSPTKPSEESPTKQPPETPQKRTDPEIPATKGPGKHSPISSTSKIPHRVGLSKRARIAPLLKIIKR